MGSASIRKIHRSEITKKGVSLLGLMNRFYVNGFVANEAGVNCAQGLLAQHVKGDQLRENKFGVCEFGGKWVRVNEFGLPVGGVETTF